MLQHGGLGCAGSAGLPEEYPEPCEDYEEHVGKEDDCDTCWAALEACWDDYEKHPPSENTGECECRECRLGREAVDMRSATRYISYIKKTEPHLVVTAMWRRALYLCRANRSICIMDPPPRRERRGKPVEPVEVR